MIQCEEGTCTKQIHEGNCITEHKKKHITYSSRRLPKSIGGEVVIQENNKRKFPSEMEIETEVLTKISSQTKKKFKSTKELTEYVKSMETSTENINNVLGETQILFAVKSSSSDDIETRVKDQLANAAKRIGISVDKIRDLELSKEKFNNDVAPYIEKYSDLRGDILHFLFGNSNNTEKIDFKKKLGDLSLVIDDINRYSIEMENTLNNTNTPITKESNNTKLINTMSTRMRKLRTRTEKTANAINVLMKIVPMGHIKEEEALVKVIQNYVKVIEKLRELKSYVQLEPVAVEDLDLVEAIKTKLDSSLHFDGLVSDLFGPGVKGGISEITKQQLLEKIKQANLENANRFEKLKDAVGMALGKISESINTVFQSAQKPVITEGEIEGIINPKNNDNVLETILQD